MDQRLFVCITPDTVSPFATNPSSSKVFLAGVTGTINNIPAAEINGEHEIANVDLDYYTITVATTSANTTGFSGNSELPQLTICNWMLLAQPYKL